MEYRELPSMAHWHRSYWSYADCAAFSHCASSNDTALWQQRRL